MQQIVSNIVVKHQDIQSVLKKNQPVAQSIVNKILHPQNNSK